MPDDPAMQSLIVSPSPFPGTVRGPDGKVLKVPEGWTLVPPGDAALTRRLKAAGPTWAVQEKKGRKMFSRGYWVPTANIEPIKRALEEERADPRYAKRLAADAERRRREQVAYVEDFEKSVRDFLRFHPAHAEIEAKLAQAVTAHATPVGSGTVARTERIPIEERAESAVIAWMRHQTTAYDTMHIARIKGERREVRRMLAQRSRTLLDAYRKSASAPQNCPLCRALT
jgi:hypothetical protein